MSTNHRIVLDLITSSEQRLERKIEDRLHRVWTQKFDEIEVKTVELDRRERRISEREGIVERCDNLKKELLDREDLIIDKEIEIDERDRHVAEEESRLSKKEKKLSDQLIQIQKDKSEARALLKKKDEMEDENRSLETKNESLQAEKNRLQTSIKRLREKSKKLKPLSDIPRIKAENIKLNKENERKANEIKQLKVELSDMVSQSTLTSPAFSITDLGLLHALSCEVSDLLCPPSDIVTLGSGPFPESDFDDYLRTLNITPRVDGFSWIIVGRDDWGERLDELLNDSHLDEVRVFSQELFVAGILTTHDPFSLPSEILLRFADGHPALQHLINGGFKWPEIKGRGGGGRDEWGEKESPLSLMGYHVGKTKGESTQKRRAILRRAYLGELEKLPDQEYMRKWGRPNQSKRLERIANHIADEIRKNQRRKNCGRALRDWKDDLAWLEKEFYTTRMRFKWPGF